MRKDYFLCFRTRCSMWTYVFQCGYNLHQCWITLQNTGSYLAWHDSLRQTIVCRHIIQAELIVGEQRVSPPEAARRTEESLIKQHEKRCTAARWNLPLVVDGDLLPVFWPREARLMMLSSNLIHKMLMFWRTNVRVALILSNFAPHSNLRGCQWR